METQPHPAITAFCQLCDRAQPVRVVDRLNAYEVVECTSCGLIFVHPLPTPEDVASFYAATTYAPPMDEGTLRAWVRSRRREFRELMEAGNLDEAPRSSSILDVGCSTGVMLEMLKAEGFTTLTGLEIDPETAAFTSRRLGIPVHVGDIDSLPEAKQFDVIWFGDSLEHMREPRRALRSAWARLTPSGRIIVRCPNVAGFVMKASRLAKRARVFRHWLTLETPLHLFHFTPRTLASLIRSIGFEMVTTRVVSVRFGYFSQLRRDDWQVLRTAPWRNRVRILVQRALWAPLYVAAHGTGLLLGEGDSVIVAARRPGTGGSQNLSVAAASSERA